MNSTSLQPAYLPFPERLTLETNPYVCNVKCTICEKHSIYNDESEPSLPIMPLKLLTKVLEEAGQHNTREIVPSTMGEPLLYKFFPQMLDLCEHYHFKLNITTNGTFPIYGAAQWASLLIPRCQDIKISLLGGTETTYETTMIGASWQAALSNINIFTSQRNQIYRETGHYCSITLKLTFMKDLIPYLSEIVRFAAAQDVDRLRGHFLLVLFPQLQSQDIYTDPTLMDAWNRAVSEAIETAKRCLRPHGQPVKLSNFDVIQNQKGTSRKTLCPYVGREMVIKANGDVVPCCVPDKQRRHLGIVGNAYTSSLSEIWHSEQYQEVRRNINHHPVCKHCQLRILDEVKC